MLCDEFRMRKRDRNEEDQEESSDRGNAHRSKLDLISSVESSQQFIEHSKKNFDHHKIEQRVSACAILLAKLGMSNCLTFLFRRRAIEIGIVQNLGLAKFEGEQQGNVAYFLFKTSTCSPFRFMRRRYFLCGTIDSTYMWRG